MAFFFQISVLGIYKKDWRQIRRLEKASLLVQERMRVVAAVVIMRGISASDCLSAKIGP